MRYLIGLDIGTSGAKGVLIDENGKLIQSTTVEYPLYQPKNGWAEQDPNDWYNASIEILKKLASGKSNEIVGLGMTGQMHGLVMLDEKDEVIRKSIIWCDQRTEKECIELTNLVGEADLKRITANPALTGFTASKILWVRNNEPENYAKCKKIMLPKDYIIYKLTGEFATDVSDASGMQLLDIEKRTWSDFVLQKLNLNKSMLARVYESQDIIGNINEKTNALTGISTKTKVVAGAGDNAAAAVGLGVVEEGKAFTTIGSSGVVFSHIKEMKLDKDLRVHTFCAAVPGEWHVMGVTQSAGASFKWFHDQILQTQASYDDLCREAKKIEIGSDNLVFLPYLYGERTPHKDPNCRGVFFGLSGIHTQAHMVRAIIEGVSFSLNNCLDVLKDMHINPNEMIMCGGGSKSELWRQIFSDITGLNSKTTVLNEGPSFGAAILAGVGSGVFDNIKQACEIVQMDKVCQTNLNAHNDYKKYYDVYNKLYINLKSIYNDFV